MLTHDIEPAIDIVKSTAGLFAGSSPNATFLSSKMNIVSEVVITKADILTFAQICNNIVDGQGDNLIKAIYLRRYFEIIDDIGLAYNLLASLLHKRDNPTIKSKTENRAMTLMEKQEAENVVLNKISGFDYDQLLLELNNNDLMMSKYTSTDVGYEKIQLFRLIKGKHEDDVISKFINESYHIENEYVMQLDPRKFDGVPEYVVKECDRLLLE